MRRAKALAAQGPCRKTLTLPAATLTSTTTLITGPSEANQGMGRMFPLRNSPQSQDSGGEVGHPQALPSSQLCEQESSGNSSEVVRQAVPGETMSTEGNLLPAGSQDTVVIHATEESSGASSEVGGVGLLANAHSKKKKAMD